MNEPEITIVGNLTNDPEIRYTQSGKPVCKLRVAQNPQTQNKETGEWEDGETLFLDVDLWGPAAENAADSLQKGMRIIVPAKLVARTFEHDGQTRRVIEAKANDVAVSLKWVSLKVDEKPF